MKPLVSVIVPLLAANDNARTCVESVFAQSYPNCELVLVARLSEREIVGACGTRLLNESSTVLSEQDASSTVDLLTAAAMSARGEFLLFLAPNDSLESEALDELYALLVDKDGDIALCPKKRVDGILEGDHPGPGCWVFSSESAMYEVLLGGRLSSFPWGFLFRRNLFEVISSDYSNCQFGEMALALRLLDKARRIVRISEACYCLRDEELPQAASVDYVTILVKDLLYLQEACAEVGDMRPKLHVAALQAYYRSFRNLKQCFKSLPGTAAKAQQLVIASRLRAFFETNERVIYEIHPCSRTARFADMLFLRAPLAYWTCERIASRID